MKEVRPSTWVLLGVLLLFIFAPLFFINVDGLKGKSNEPIDNGIRPSNPLGPSVPDNAPANKPADAPGNDASPDNTGPRDPS